MKIKTKKKFTLPKLIEWAWDNDDATGVRFQSDGFVTTVYFGKNGDVSVEDCSKDALFTVEIEEEITEYTMFNYLLLTYKTYDDKIETHYYEDRFIKSVLKQSNRLMYVSEQLSITYFDDKGIPHLIWTHEKGLAE